MSKDTFGKIKLYKDKSWLVHKYIDEKLSTYQISNVIGCSQPTVCFWLKKHNIKSRNISEAMNIIIEKKCGKEPRYKNKDWLYQKYVVECKTLTDISKLCNCSIHTIKYWVKEHVIPERTRLYYNKDWLYQKYIVEDTSVINISKLCNCSIRIIYHYLEKFSISKSNPLKQYDEEWFYDKYVKEKLSIISISKMLKCGVSSISYLMGKYGIRRRTISEANYLRFQKDSREYKSKDWLYDQYNNKKLSVNEIGKLFDVTPDVIFYWMNKHNIKRRIGSESQKLRFKNHPEDREHLSKLLKGRIISENCRSAVSKRLKGKTVKENGHKPDCKCCYCNKVVSEETKKKMSISRTDWDFFVETGYKYTRSTYPYSSVFNKKLKKKVRELYNNKCVVTGMTNEEHKKKYGSNLHIHHWTYDKDVTDLFYMVPVTNSINSQANYNRAQWRDMFLGIAEDRWCEMMQDE